MSAISEGMLREPHRQTAAPLFSRRFRRWLIAWSGAPVLAIVNGAIRELGYKGRVGESTANQISVGSLILLLTAYFSVLQRRWPLDSRGEALSVGAAWAALSVLFEFGFGHFVEGDSWSELARAYDVTEGNLFVLIPAWVIVGPAVVRAAMSTSTERTWAT